MKQLLIILLAVTTATAGAATFELRKRIICDTPKEIFTKLAEEYGERVEWTGHSDIQSTDVVLTVNPELGTWTIVEYTNEVACVLAVGDKSSSKLGKITRFLMRSENNM
jgi:hypothetical protein